MNIKGKVIFISALDWGLGHATRCIPIVKQLSKDNVVILGVTPLTKLIFDEEFPNLQKVDIEPYSITYSKKLPLWLALLIDSPRLFRVIKKENEQLKHFITQYNIDVVISDNRFGLNNESVFSVYVTHQLNIRAGAFSFIANQIHHRFMKRFNEVWVPDFNDKAKRLAGNLSEQNDSIKVKYIGPQTRLNKSNVSSEKLFNYLFLLSGPEPHRTLLEKELLQLAQKHQHLKFMLVRGTRQQLEVELPLNVTSIDVPRAEQLSGFIENSQKIICRSGYSTLMDLYLLNNLNCILIPTPSQTEQLYLAEYWNEKFGVKYYTQDKLNKLVL